ncbi:LemA family protein [Candidatus Woesearchaeota archaeon]|nr:LemA family protein [Candidatus Woesearchaeota archaeon]
MAKKKSNKKKYWLIGAGIILLLLILWLVFSFNKLVVLDNTADEKWANVETQYQRRVDLIPNLVSTVKGYATHEKELFTEITQLRSQWAGAKTPADKMTAAQGLEGAISKLLLVAENYPNLKANENFLSLQDELAGTENRISVERTRFNTAVKDYNIAIRRIPTNIVAALFGFSKKEMFEAEIGAEKSPLVEF